MRVFMIATLIHIAAYDIYVFSPCYQIFSKIRELSWSILIPTYFIQSVFCMLIFFNKVRGMLQNSVLFSVSKITIGIFYSFFVLLVSWCILCIIERVIFMSLLKIQVPIFFRYISILSILAYALTNISLVIFFIYKMVNLYKQLSRLKDKNDIAFLLVPITKVAILSTLSFVMTVATACYVIIGNITGNPNLAWFGYFIAIFDIFTNFLCIMLSHKLFDHEYQLLCSCIDTICQRCWGNIALTENEVNMVEQIEIDTKTKSIEIVTTNGVNSEI